MGNYLINLLIYFFLMNVNSKTSTKQLEDLLQHTMKQAKVEILLKGITEKCFKTCINPPKNSFRNNDKKCVRNCTGIYIASIGLIEHTLVEDIEKQNKDDIKRNKNYPTEADTFSEDANLSERYWI